MGHQRGPNGPSEEGGTVEVPVAAPLMDQVALHPLQGEQPQNVLLHQAAVNTGIDMDLPTFPSNQSVDFDNETAAFIWEDIDLGDLNSYFLDPLRSLEDCPSRLPKITQTRPDPGKLAEETGLAQSHNAAAAAVEQLWFTRLESDCGNTANKLAHTASGESTPKGSKCAREDINEVYRINLTNRLRPRYSEEPLPSTDFLKLSLQMYFDRVNPSFPIFHAATFRPTEENGFLLLSLCALGCLFVGSEEATRYGSTLFERLLRAMMTSWDFVIAKHAEEKVPMVQTALIGQTFMMLSGNPRHVAIASAFHGTVISWARRADLMTLKHEPVNLEGLSGSQLASAWRSWARREEMQRTALAVFIHDAELAALFHHEPFLRYGGKNAPIASSSEAFSAATVNSWVRAMRKDTNNGLHDGAAATPSPSLRYQLPNEACSHSMFSAYVILECIGAAICEERVAGTLDTTAARKYETDLIAWYEVFGEKAKAESDPQFLLVLWHWTFISQFVDLNRLELAAGKKGVVAADSSVEYLTEWSSSVASKRCLIHAYLLQKHMEGRSTRRPVAIHVPRCLFSAAISWSSFFLALRNNATQDIEGSQKNVGFAEFRMLGLDFSHQWSDVIGFRNGNVVTIMGNTLCTLADMLRQTGHWGIAQRFAQILGPLIHEGDEGLLPH
ncbi:uncharacterized protein PV07_09468 [Cladophialophora immunda]|uniref:Xylanolytic transcriptional activator regulatory domain-containing protein n=1 Tax=Cladophialophora immunda TaxID=569365 RepID=A0A0D2C5B8_9EURO|nr:uncharacterized protein PV07_09468 [Cladophialophora immunda]KIW26368.1 hypothetical protein PV07_09468 [Cladophialophora immunda]